jgi:vacuolar protein-sorting-associated protein 4
MASINFLAKASEYAKSAAFNDGRDASEAKRLYVLAVEALTLAIKYEKNESRRLSLKQKQSEYLARAEELAGSRPSETPVAASDAPETKRDEKELDVALSHVILRERPNVKWDDIAGLHEAKRLLKEATIMPRRFPELFVGDRKPWSGILLYGPPGTGKSFLAKAVATEATGSTFFSVSAADLVSKWVGDSPKLVQRLFQAARDHRPAVIFIDEIDALCQTRSGDGDRTSEASRQLLTQLLLELDGVGKGMSGITLLGATNVPWLIDAAMRRRLQKRIYIPLPQAPSRLTLFRNRLANVTHTLTGDDFRMLAELTDGFSGSDIANVVCEALHIPLRMIEDAMHFKSVPGDKWTPCSPGDPDGISMEWESIPAGALVLPALTMSHFRQSIANTRSSVSSQDLNAFVEWTQSYGQDG